MRSFTHLRGLELTTEYPSPDEQVHVDSLINRLRDKMRRDYAGGRTLRDAHPKMHGCVRAEFAIEPQLPDEARIGVFKEPRTFQAWVRFSNQSGTVGPDSTRDIRGMAIKLLDVEGPKLLSSGLDGTTQDFIFISDRRFVTKDIVEFDGLVKSLLSGFLSAAWFFLNPFDSHLRVLRNLLCSLKHCDDVLDIQYYSASPYLFGPRAVKYSVKPSSPQSITPPDKSTDDYLREMLARRLATDSATFDFMVQFQMDPYRMPIEDPGVAWNEKVSPFQKVATLTIPAQEFDSIEQRTFGDNLSFNPWHCLPEHRPLGGINRARRQIYQTLSAFRHQQNGLSAATLTEV
jgi:hypothetical protein